ncbi:MAG TPA: hypothetical protein VKQ34_04145 [Candidatus Saccharimonadales bacterium]|nr:hypothetical protein [Candidatus Saccharimonadales bacterium]
MDDYWPGFSAMQYLVAAIATIHFEKSDYSTFLPTSHDAAYGTTVVHIWR